MTKSLRNYSWLLIATALSAACGLGAFQGAKPFPTPGPKPVPQPVVTHNVACVVADENGRPVEDATCAIGSFTGQTNGDGYYLLLGVPACSGDGCLGLHVSKDGYDPADVRFVNDHDLDVGVTLHRQRVDPSNIPLGQLAAIRGAMWPSASACPGGLVLPYGPRPGQPDNIIATDFFANYSADEQLAIVTCLRALGYTHVVMGPIVDSDGYHGQYAPHDWHWEDAAHLNGDNFDKFLDIAQYFWDHQLAPVVFLHPDGWTFEQTRDTLTPLLQQPRAQQLLRIVVPTGWEPTKYGWSSCTWAAFAQWARQTLPNALVLIHTVADVDAPVGTDERCDDNGHPNGEGWARVTPFIHGWLIQNGAYSTSPAENPPLATNFGAQFKVDGDGAAQHSVAWHFAGNAGWPTNSAWGNVPILLYAGEVTAFNGYWNNLAESARDAWGDLAIAAGAAGYLDGGTVPVPVRR
jgi:hypothetical protein